MAKKIVSFLGNGDVIALMGELGVGKTTLTKAIAKEIGIDAEITSPTFVVMKEYFLDQNVIPNNIKGANTLVHVDCYRFNSVEDAFSVGLDEYFNRQDTIMIIEWAERIEAILPKKTKVIKLQYLGETEREAEIKWLSE